jgi:hypothetical protein
MNLEARINGEHYTLPRDLVTGRKHASLVWKKFVASIGSKDDLRFMDPNIVDII